MEKIAENYKNDNDIFKPQEDDDYLKNYDNLLGNTNK